MHKDVCVTSFGDLIPKKERTPLFECLRSTCVSSSHKTSLQVGEFIVDITCLLDLMMAREIIRLKDGGEVAVRDNAHKRTCK